MVYAVAQLTIHDRERYFRYVSRFAAVLAPYRGRVLAADDAAQAIEGVWTHHRIVILEFPDEPAFRAWRQSEAYQRIATDRLAASEGTVLLVHGLAGGRA